MLISQSTPVEYREAIKDGVNYWNNIFGKTVLNVEIQKSDQEIYDINTNTIQWVNFKEGDGAYVDLKADPISGEITQQNVFITSFYLEFTKNLSKTHSDVLFKLKGFKSIPTAEHRDFGEVPASFSEKGGLSKDQLLIAKQDMLRFVAAHEIGHSLGLRHNFAASLHSNITVKRQQELYKKYLETFKVPNDVIPVSSVMEYPGFIDRLLVGRLIKQGQTFSYDNKAIKWAYFDKKLSELKKQHFCTDDHVYTYYDCERRDSTTNPTKHRFEVFKDAVAASPYNYLYQYLSFNRKKEHEKDGATIELDPSDHAYDLANKINNILDIYSKDAILLQTRTYLEDNFINKDELNKQDIEIKKNTLNINEFYSYILDLYQTNSLAKQWQQDFEKIKQTSLSNSYQALSDELKQDAEDKSKHYFKKLEKELLESIIQRIASVMSSSVNEGIDIESYEQFASKLAETIILKKSTSDLILVSNQTGESISVEKFYFSFKTRDAAKKLLSASSTIKGFNDVLSVEKARIKGLYNQQLEIFDRLKAEGYVIPRSLKPYISKQKSLF